MRKPLIIILMFFMPCVAFTQGFNHTWLLGYSGTGRINFFTNYDTLITENRKIKFNDTEANICDSVGNLLMSSNGLWIANKDNDTMVNGNDLIAHFGFDPDGSYLLYSNIILRYPADSSKYILFHHTLDTVNGNYKVRNLYKTIIDMSLDSGRGAVISKNDTVLAKILNASIAACRHANGRD